MPAPQHLTDGSDTTDHAMACLTLLIISFKIALRLVRAMNFVSTIFDHQFKNVAAKQDIDEIKFGVYENQLIVSHRYVFFQTLNTIEQHDRR